MEEAPAKKKRMPTWAIVLIVVGALSVPCIGIFSALAIYGVRKYMRNAKVAESVAALGGWSKGMVACGERDGQLPATSPAVPASLASIAAMKYQSAPGEWTDPAFACSGFAMTGPQYFQYQWVQLSPTEGALKAAADLDGDGTAEESFEVQITCAGGRCTNSALPSVVTR